MKNVRTRVFSELKFFLLFLFWNAIFIYAKNPYVALDGEINIGFNGAKTASYFASDTVDRFGSNWRALHIPLETARSYEEVISPMFALTLKAGYKNFSLLIEAPLRKDLEAWYDSDLKTNFTLNPSELDINVPKTAYARYDYSLGFFQLGRFKPDVGPSENTLSLGGAPYHDAFWASFNPSVFRYDFMLISLNAWLHGDTRDSTGCPPVGTEAYEQKCPSSEKLYENNQRGRIYDENYKNLVYHRIGMDLDFLWISFTEMSMIGGKSLEFRSINPFIFWHNNYASGYTKASALFEIGARPIEGASFYGQMHIEDIKSPVGETGGESTRSVLSFLVGYSQDFSIKNWGNFNVRFDVVKTDPAYNHGHFPLLSYTSRQMYRSNYREQSDDDFADMFFVDYPIGYRRGSDALDMWFKLSWEKDLHSFTLSLAYLQQGDKEMNVSYEEALASKHTLSGIVETEFLFDLLYKRKFWNEFTLYLGGGGTFYENLDHVEGENGFDFWIRSGVSFTFSFRKEKK